MAVPNNILQNVITYQNAELAWLLNSFYAINQSNKKFKNFNKLVANLGDAVSFDTTPRYITYPGLVITQQPSVQRTQQLICAQAFNTSAGYTDQQFILNVEDYMEKFGKAAMLELGTKVETDVLKNITSSVQVNDPQSDRFGDVQYKSGPFRFAGDGVTPINSFEQLAQFIANFNDFGAAKNKLQGVIPTVAAPQIIGSGLNQFAVNRNNDIAMSWELGKFANCEWFTSNLLPLHISGSVGDAASPNNILTLVSTNDPTGENVTIINVTEPTGGTNANAIKAGDLLMFVDGVTGQANARFLTFIGHVPSSQPVQFRAIADAGSVAGAISIPIQTINEAGLVWMQNQNQNLNRALTAGMQIKVMPSHRAGLLHSGDQYYLAMPKLPDEEPFFTSTVQDPDSGASIRHYRGSQLGLNNRVYVRDEIHGSCLVPENAMRLLFPM